MFVLIHARIPRLASMIFYMEYFSFEVGKNSDLKYVIFGFPKVNWILRLTF